MATTVFEFDRVCVSDRCIHHRAKEHIRQECRFVKKRRWVGDWFMTDDEQGLVYAPESATDDEVKAELAKPAGKRVGAAYREYLISTGRLDPEPIPKRLAHLADRKMVELDYAGHRLAAVRMLDQEEDLGIDAEQSWETVKLR